MTPQDSHSGYHCTHDRLLRIVYSSNQITDKAMPWHAKLTVSRHYTFKNKEVIDASFFLVFGDMPYLLYLDDVHISF